MLLIQLLLAHLMIGSEALFATKFNSSRAGRPHHRPVSLMPLDKPRSGPGFAFWVKVAA